jgi:hypothetical protein
MAKKKKIKIDEAIDTPTEPVVNVAKISVAKYFQLKDPPIHIYTKAALIEKFRGIIKTEEEWSLEMEDYK